MGHHSVIIMFAIWSFMGWYASTAATKRTIKDIGIFEKYYPDKYIMPSRRFRKMFRLKKQEIPKWLYASLCMSFVYIILWVLLIVLYFSLDNKYWVAQIFYWIYGVVMGVHMITIFINVFLFKL